MSGLTRRRWKSLAAAVAAGMCLFSAGAAGAAATADLSPEQAGRVRAERDAQALAALPAGWQPVQPGAFTVGIHPAAPPVSTYATDARTVVGADVDIAQLVADALGLKLVQQPVAWADWPLGLASGRYDAVISNVGAIQRLAQPRDVAGLRIITSSGTIQERILLEWNWQNQAAGLPALTLQYYDDDAARTRLAPAVTAALNRLIDNGKYAQALARWGLEAEALPKAETHPPGLPKF